MTGFDYYNVDLDEETSCSCSICCRTRTPVGRYSYLYSEPSLDSLNLDSEEDMECNCRICYRTRSPVKPRPPPPLYSGTRINYRDAEWDESVDCGCQTSLRTRTSMNPQPSLYGGTIALAPNKSAELRNTPRSATGTHCHDSWMRSPTPAHSTLIPRNNHGIDAKMTVTVYADASLSGFGFWSPQLNRGFYGDLPRMPQLDDINFMEYYAVANAILWASKKLEPGDHLLVYTDSLNTVNKFNDGPAEEEYDELMEAVDDIVDGAGIRLSVWHIPGHMNRIADCLSRPDRDLGYIYDVQPKLQVSFYNVSKRIERCASYC